MYTCMHVLLLQALLGAIIINQSTLIACMVNAHDIDLWVMLFIALLVGANYLFFYQST